MDSVAIYDYIQGSTMQITIISQKSRADLFFKHFHSSQGQSICFHNFKNSFVSNDQQCLKRLTPLIFYLD